MVTVRRSAPRRHAPCVRGRGSRVLARAHRRPSRRPVPVEGSRLFFSGRISQQMARPTRFDWLAGGAMLLAGLSWGVLASLLGG
jgi:hypothetical protein